MQVQENLSVEKYLKAIVVMTNSVGKLDVLKLHLKSMYDDKMSIAIIESVISDLAQVAGVDYKMMQVELPKRKPLSEETRQVINEHNINMGYTAPVKPAVIEVVEAENAPEFEEEIETKKEIKKPVVNINKTKRIDNGFAKYMNLSNSILKKRAEKKAQNKGIEIDESTGNMTYQFVNSSTLEFMIYNKEKKELTMTFKRNGRIYLYKQVPVFMFQNLVQIDENGKTSVGSYFQQNIAKQPKKYPYKEITNEEFVG